jgi:carboxypeptidase T
MKIAGTLRSCVAWVCGAILLCAPIRSAFAGDPTALVSVPADAPGLVELGLELEHVLRDGDRLVLAASEWDRDQLERAGIGYRVLHPDLESFYAARLRAERWLWGGASPESTPGFGFGSMGGYYTWSEVGQKLDEMRLRYPSIVTAKRSLGLSHEGREVWMVMISDNVDRADEHEPAALFTGLTHAREPMGMEVVLYTMFHLLENYGIDPEATYLVNERQMVFVPVLNPDGYVYNQTTNPNGGGMWRKNRRDNGGGVYGVDLNRNYGYQWGYNNQGSSPSPGSDTYRGPAAFSEPETTAIRTFHGYQQVVTAFHYHAYGNYEIHPFAYQANAFPPAPDLDRYLRFGADIKALNGFKVGNCAQTLGYLANGESIDWSYGEQVEKDKVFAFLPEVGTSGDGFWPPSSRIVPLAELNLEPNLYWAWIAGASGELVQVSAAPTVPAGATAPVVATVENRGLGAPAKDLSVSLEASDPYVTIAVAKKPFPEVAAQAVVNNSGDPLEFLVSPSAPPSHAIALTLTLEQGGVVRGRQVLWVTTQ